jgi:GMP synthase-like glutamine amidotransferase
MIAASMKLTGRNDPSKIRVYTQRPYLEDENELFAEYGYQITPSLVEADIIVFTGGQDINPALYGETIHPTTNFSEIRDRIEVAAFRQARAKMKIGLCRGAQLLNALNGGKLWQNINNHHSAHEITDRFTGQVIKTTSIHHQQMMPSRDAVVVATCHVSTKKESPGRTWELNKTVGKSDKAVDGLAYLATDHEVLWYPETRSLCFQGHPGWAATECQDYFMELVSRYY